MPLPSYQTVPLPSFSAMQPSGLGQSAEYERVLSLLHDVDERVAELYPQLSDHWLQSELYAFLHVKDELVSRVKKRASRKLSVAAGVADRRKELRVSTTNPATTAASAQLTSPDSGATEIAKSNILPTPSNEAMAATPARNSKALSKAKPSVSNKQRVSAALKEMAGEEADEAAPSESQPASTAATAVTDKEEEAKEAEVASPLPQVTRVTSTMSTKGRTSASITGGKQKTEAKRLTANNSSSSSAGSQSAIPVFTASAAAANRKKVAVPAFARKGGRSASEVPAAGQTARVLQEEHAELAQKLDELQTRHKQLADKQDKYIMKRQREEEDKRKREAEAAASAQSAAAEEQQAASESAVLDAEAESSESLKPPVSPGRLAPLPLDGPTSPRSPRHTPSSSMANALSALSARPLRPNSPSLPPLSSASASSPQTARVAAAPLSARDLIVQPTAYHNDEAQRGTVCSGLLLCAPTPRPLLRPSTQEAEGRHTEQAVEQVEQAVDGADVEAEVAHISNGAQAEQLPAEEVVHQSEQTGLEVVTDADAPQHGVDLLMPSAVRPLARSADNVTADGLSTTSPLPAPTSVAPPNSTLSTTSSNVTSRATSPLLGAAQRTLRPSTAEISHSAAGSSQPSTPSSRGRMVHRAGQPIGLATVPIPLVGGMQPILSARSRAPSSETAKGVYEESFPTFGSRRGSMGREEAAVVAEAVKGLGNLVENNRMEAAVEAAEARIKEERWTAVMKDSEKRKRRGEGEGEGEEADEEAARQRRKWRDESLITASELRKQIAMMGIRIDEADETAEASATGEQRAALPLPIEPADVPLPPSARTTRTARTARTARASPRPTTSSLAQVDVTEQTDASASQQQPETEQPTEDGLPTAASVLDPTEIPLPLSARSAQPTARTGRMEAQRNEVKQLEKTEAERANEQQPSADRGLDRVSASDEVSVEASAGFEADQQPFANDEVPVMETEAAAGEAASQDSSD